MTENEFAQLAAASLAGALMALSISPPTDQQLEGVLAAWRENCRLQQMSNKDIGNLMSEVMSSIEREGHDVPAIRRLICQSLKVMTKAVEDQPSP
jgi:hypothetical protein